ncbi:type IV pilin N-terminal domain-containing protein [Methanosarcina sp.]|uniref:type IV pilin N-terminal domain-containing protein n=1 Tax=Methanosarcina sp. TaxID=2213 RepID=UPI002AB95D5A|nr:type IV pilin N-terminal domain-containing protein [Methanosarcina sp.]MDY9926569.1 type IV pilin N-terminal domain-containing protein [Methanosarcina sp.]
MEGKKYRALNQDCQAVSEVIGQVLMVAIVVLAFSSIALTVFSDEGAINPPHVPRTDLQESIQGNTVQIFHSGGEAIDLKDIKIILSVDGEQEEFEMSDSNIYGHTVTVFDPKGEGLSPNDVFTLGDFIEITPSSVDIKNASSIDLYFVHTASKQVIKKAML